MKTTSHEFVFSDSTVITALAINFSVFSIFFSSKFTTYATTAIKVVSIFNLALFLSFIPQRNDICK